MFYVPFSHYEACEALYLSLQFTSQNIILIKPHLSSYSTNFQHITIKNRLKLQLHNAPTVCCFSWENHENIMKKLESLIFPQYSDQVNSLVVRVS